LLSTLWGSISRIDQRPLHEVFRSKYAVGETLLPPFFEGSFLEACKEAQKQFRFLVVYLHSPLHPYTDAFCSEVLCHPQVISVLLNDFVLWGASVASSVGYERSQVFQVSTFPFVAVLECTSSQQPKMLLKMEGPIRVPFLVERLESVMADNGAVLVSNRAEVQEREERAMLRAQQEAELADTLRIDRERQSARLAREEAERLQREEAARKEREAAEAADHLVRQRAIWRAECPPESALGDRDTAILRITLLDGSVLERRFQKEDQIGTVLKFVKAQESYNGENIIISTPVPVRSLDPSLTVEQAGLFPRARVVVKRGE